MVFLEQVFIESFICVNFILFQHAPHCPVRHMTEQDHLSLANSPLVEKSVAVAVAVILESSDGKVLMTQRAQHMRSFPRAWVPPGGHLGSHQEMFTSYQF